MKRTSATIAPDAHRSVLVVGVTCGDTGPSPSDRSQAGGRRTVRAAGVLSVETIVLAALTQVLSSPRPQA